MQIHCFKNHFPQTEVLSEVIFRENRVSATSIMIYSHSALLYLIYFCVFACNIVNSETAKEKLSESLSRCDACTAVIHNAYFAVKRAEKIQASKYGYGKLSKEDFNLIEMCDMPVFHKSYGYKSLMGVKRLSGPGLEVISALYGPSQQKDEAANYMVSSCREISEDLNENFLSIYYQFEDNKESYSSADQFLFGIVKEFCINLTTKCESSTKFVEQYKKDKATVANLQQNVLTALAKTQVDDLSTDNKKKLDFLDAKEKCLQGKNIQDICEIVKEKFLESGTSALTEWVKMNNTLTAQQNKSDKKSTNNNADDDEEEKEETEISKEMLDHAINYSEQAFRYALDLKPGLPSAVYHLGFILKEKKRYTDAFNILKAVSSFPLENYQLASRSWRLICELLFHRGDHAGAIESAIIAVELDPDNTEAKRLLAILNVNKVIVSLNNADDDDDDDESKKLLETNALWRAFNRDSNGKLNLITQNFTSYLEIAVAARREALILDPLSTEVLPLGVAIYLREASIDGVLSKLDIAMINSLRDPNKLCKFLNPDTDEICHTLYRLSGDELLNYKFYALASDTLNLAVRFNEGNSATWGNLALALTKIGKIEDATKAFEKMKEAQELDDEMD